MSVTLLCTIFYVYIWTCLSEINLYIYIYIYIRLYGSRVYGMDSKRLICIVSLDDKGERAYSMVEVALRKGANSYCVAMHCRIQRLLAPLATGIGIQRTHRA